MDPEAGNRPKVRALTPEEMRERNKLREAQLGRKTLHVVKIDDQITRERKKAYKESVIDNVKYFAKQYRQVEYDFMSKIKDRPLQLVDNEKEFKVWENEAAECYNKMKENEIEANFTSQYERDRVEDISILEVANTIEVYSGHFFEKRKDDIIEAIENSPESKDRAENLDTVTSLEKYALEHVWAVRDYKNLRPISARAYADNCRNTHNALIDRLNKINSIAREHNVTPLTFRNFETNVYYYNKKEDFGGFTDARAEYDRAIVEKYCENAFSSIGDTRNNLITTEVANSVADFHHLGED